MKSALIGFGYWGEKILRTLKEMGHEVCVFDTDLRDKKLDDIRLCSSYDEALRCSSCVFIATPPKSHAELIKIALKNNKHIFAEKPLSLDSKTSAELLDMAQNSGLVLHVDHIFLYSPAVLWIKENLSKIGKIFSVECARLGFGRFDTDIDALYDLGLHDVSILEFIFDLESSDIYATERKHYISKFSSHPSHVKVAFRARDIDFSITSSWMHPQKIRNITFYGEYGSITYDDCAEKKITLRLDSWHIPELDSKMPLDLSIARFFERISRKETGQDLRVIKVMKILERLT